MTAPITKDTKVKLWAIDKDDHAIIQQAARRLWDEMAGDMLTAIAEDKGKSVYEVTISRKDVVELVIDADRLSEELEKRHKRPDLAKFIREGPRAARDKIVTAAFAYTRYGM